MDKEKIKLRFKNLQDDICEGLEALDGQAKFREDLWTRPGGGGGRTRIIGGQGIIEKGGVNLSAVHGQTPEKIARALQVEQGEFFATGVSIVMHPTNPWVPIIHMNVRFFEMDNGLWWFGGGIDLTPHYVIADDARFFHKELKKTCDRFDASYYGKFKDWADNYFFIKHRDETRGIGGIFFDRLGDGKDQIEKCAGFTFSVSETFLPIYSALINRNKSRTFTEREKDWQALRRGRYVEFNLVYDKGTKFGLDTDGRAESILMSLPPRANWHYDHRPADGSAEAETLKFLKKGIDWINL